MFHPSIVVLKHVYEEKDTLLVIACFAFTCDVILSITRNPSGMILCEFLNFEATSFPLHYLLMLMYFIV